MRKQQNGAVVGTARAELTKSWDQRDTVTVSATLELGPHNAQSTVIQLTEDAAQALLSDLLRLIPPPSEPRFNVDIVFKDNRIRPRTFTDARYRRGPDWFVVSDSNGETFFNVREVLLAEVERA